MPIGLSAAGTQEWRAHWKLVLSASIGMSMAGIVLSSMGAFIKPIEESLGWSRAQIASGLTVYAAVGVICAPFYGRLVDRWGPRRMGVPGVLLCGCAVALYGTANGSNIQWLGLWLLYSLTAQIPKPLTWTAAVSSEFEASRGLALAVMLSGGTLGGIVAPIIANHLIADLGWRNAYVAMGFGWGGLAFLVCLLFFYGKSDRLRTAGAPKEVAAAALDGLTAREAFMSARFYKIGITALLTNSLGVALLVHMIPLLEGTGLPAEQAIWLVGLSHIGGIAGAILCGSLVNKVAGNILGGIFFSLPVLSCSMLLIPADTLGARLVPVLLQSIAGGAQVHMYAYLTTRYFGLRAYGSIFGIFTSLLALGVGIGPLVAGFIFDKTRSYDLFLMGVIPMAVVTGLLMFSLGRYPVFSSNRLQAAH